MRLYARPAPPSVREAMRRARKSERQRERVDQEYRSRLSLLLDDLSRLSYLHRYRPSDRYAPFIPETSATICRKISDHIAKMDAEALAGKASPFDPNARTMDGTTFFLKAVQSVSLEEHKNLLQMMLDRGADVNLYGIRTTFKDRVEKDDRHTIYREFREDYANMHNAHTPLLAALYKFKALCFYRPLVDSTATATVAAAIRAAGGATAEVAAAAEKSHSEAKRVAKTFVEMLLAAGADPNLVAPYIKGVPPLIVAVQAALGANGGILSPDVRRENLKRCAQVIACLLHAGADRNGRDDDGRTALMHLVMQPRLRTIAANESEGVGVVIMERLMRLGADPNLYSYCGETALTMAIEKDYVAATRALLRWGACTKEKVVEHTAIRELQRRVVSHLGVFERARGDADWRHCLDAYTLVRNYGPYGGPDLPHVVGPVWLAQARVDALLSRPPQYGTEPLHTSLKIRSLVRSRHHWRRARIKFKVRQLVIFWGSLCLAPDKVDMEQDLASATEGMEGVVGGLGA